MDISDFMAILALCLSFFMAGYAFGKESSKKHK